MPIARARSAAELASITNAIHDRWFALERIHFDEPGRSVSVEILEEREYLRAVNGGDAAPSMRLVIEGADALTIEDTEEVGYYDLNKIEFEQTARVVRLLTSTPLKFEIRVDRLDVSVEGLA